MFCNTYKRRKCKIQLENINDWTDVGYRRFFLYSILQLAETG